MDLRELPNYPTDDDANLWFDEAIARPEPHLLAIAAALSEGKRSLRVVVRDQQRVEHVWSWVRPGLRLFYVHPSMAERALAILPDADSIHVGHEALIDGRRIALTPTDWYMVETA